MTPRVPGEFLLTRMDAGGDAWGHDVNGEPICVRGGVPGDVVVATGGAQRRQRRRGFTVVHESSERRASPCRVQARCGGCRLMPLHVDAQRRVKLELLSLELARRGIRAPKIRWEPSPSELAYRNRIRLRIADGAFQFFNPNKDETCLVLVPSLREALDRLRALPPSIPVVPFSHAEIRAADLDGRPGLALTAWEGKSAGATHDALSAFAAQLPHFLLGVCGDTHIAAQRRKLGALDLFVPLDAFLQVNDAVNQGLVERIVETLRSLGVGSVLDLFAGAGNFSLPLAAAGLAVTAVERHAASVAALSRSAARAGLACEGIASGADVAVADLRARQRRFDCVVVDAPRAGAGELLGGLAELASRFVVLCSCYAPGFARDLEALLAIGFELQTITAWDMFPETHHLESVALLARG